MIATRDIINALRSVIGYELNYHETFPTNEAAANAIRALLPAVQSWEDSALSLDENSTYDDYYRWLERGKRLYQGIVQYRTEPVTDAWDGLMKDLTTAQVARDLAGGITAVGSFVGSIIPWWMFAAGATILILLVARNGN